MAVEGHDGAAVGSSVVPGGARYPQLVYSPNPFADEYLPAGRLDQKDVKNQWKNGVAPGFRS